jgi:hypothetical protein
MTETRLAASKNVTPHGQGERTRGAAALLRMSDFRHSKARTPASGGEPDCGAGVAAVRTSRRGARMDYGSAMLLLIPAGFVLAMAFFATRTQPPPV